MSIRIQELSIEERIQLVEDLCDSIRAEQHALLITAAQRLALDRRLDAYELDRQSGRLATDVITEIRLRL